MSHRNVSNIDLFTTDENYSTISVHCPDEGINSFALLIPYSVIGLLICVTNIMTLRILYRVKALQTTTYGFIACLSIADLLVGAWTLPMSFLATPNLFQSLQLAVRVPLCQVCMLVISISAGASAYCVLLIAIERYIAILHPFRYLSLVTKTRIKIAMVVFWAIGWPLLIYTTLRFGHADKACSCILTEFVDPLAYLFGYFLPVASILPIAIILYARIFYVAWQQQRRISAEENQVNGISPNVKHKDERKILKMMAQVYVAFLTCWFQFIVIQSVGFVKADERPRLNMLFHMSNMIVLCNSFINPPIYAWKDSRFRAELRNTCGIKPTTDCATVVSF